jgi:putative addiction module killer protein
MYEIKTTQHFDAWLDRLDVVTQAKLVARLRTVTRGLFGDCASAGDGVSELREHFGPGYRMYFVMKGRILIVMLGGGDKSSQKNDIKQAKKEAKEMLEEDD